MTIDENQLQNLVPLNGLTFDMRNELAQKSRTDTVTKGRYAFKHGDNDSESVYIVEGEVELLSEAGDALKQIKAGTEEAMHPLAPGQPRLLSARVVADATFIRINRDLIDLMFDVGSLLSPPARKNKGAFTSWMIQ